MPTLSVCPRQAKKAACASSRRAPRLPRRDLPIAPPPHYPPPPPFPLAPREPHPLPERFPLPERPRLPTPPPFPLLPPKD
jgi:hypothetical protein